MMEKKRSVSLLPALICLAGMQPFFFCGETRIRTPYSPGCPLSAAFFWSRIRSWRGGAFRPAGVSKGDGNLRGSKGEDGRRDFLAAMDMRRRILLRPFRRLGLRERGKGEREG